jgi:hypothetical protein
LAKLYYNSTMHLATKMFVFESMLGKEARKPMGLTIPMGRINHSRKLWRWSKNTKKNMPEG